MGYLVVIYSFILQSQEKCWLPHEIYQIKLLTISIVIQKCLFRKQITEYTIKINLQLLYNYHCGTHLTLYNAQQLPLGSTSREILIASDVARSWLAGDTARIMQLGCKSKQWKKKLQKDAKSYKQLPF